MYLTLEMTEPLLQKVQCWFIFLKSEGNLASALLPSSFCPVESGLHNSWLFILLHPLLTNCLALSVVIKTNHYALKPHPYTYGHSMFSLPITPETFL